MGALLDHRPGVVTKGFRSLAHDPEQEDNWQMDQPEEDEVPCDSFSGVSGENSASVDLPRSTSSPFVYCNKNGDFDDISQSEMSLEEMCLTKEVFQAKDGQVANVSLSFSSPPPSPLPSSEMNGHVDLKELQALQPTTVDHMPGEGALSWGH